jgi:hypothetical protein
LNAVSQQPWSRSSDRARQLRGDGAATKLSGAVETGYGLAPLCCVGRVLLRVLLLPKREKIAVNGTFAREMQALHNNNNNNNI